MVLILLEALAALLLLLFIVWWTMFSGRKNGELPGVHEAEAPVADPKPASVRGTPDGSEPRV